LKGGFYQTLAKIVQTPGITLPVLWCTSGSFEIVSLHYLRKWRRTV